MDLYLLTYNNYINRIVKKESTLNDYLEYQTCTQQNVNFNPNDGITTTQVINDYESSDYLLVVDDEDEIVSRWFIIDAKRNLIGQYLLSLRRDVNVDNYEKIINAPMYIEKGWLKDINDSAIFNKENLALNQIKVKEDLLKDKFGVAWLVAFIDSSITNTSFSDLFSDGQGGYKYINYGKTIADYTTEDISTWHSDLHNNYYYANSGINDYVGIRAQFLTTMNGVYNSQEFKVKGNTVSRITLGQSTNAFSPTSTYGTVKATYTNHINNLNSDLDAIVSNMDRSAQGYYNDCINVISHFDYSKINDYNTYNGKIVHDTTSDKYYRVEATVEEEQIVSTTTSSSSLINRFENDIRSVSGFIVVDNDVVVYAVLTKYTFNLVEVARPYGKIYATGGDIDPKTSIMNDAPYMAICIPYGNIYIQNNNSVIENTVENSIASANLINYILQDGKYLIDLQLLPYCPIQEELNGGRSVIIDNNIASIRTINFYHTDGSNFAPTTDTKLSKGYVFFNSSFTFDITYSIEDKTTVLEKKIANETEMYRICSPNYSSYFEFSPYKNNGVSYFNVDCTYKPYKSYIHLNPNFKGLYGQDYNDNRGLVITSDFSIPQTTDAWQQYQINNKNYSQVFERQIQNMELNNKWAKYESITNAVVGTLQGGVTGSVTGAIAGGVGGAIAGGVLGTAGSLATGVADVAKTLELQNENMDYTKDMYNYNLQNIQALPNSLSSISSFDVNNKLFPFIEKYTCTSIEEEALINKLTYNGMKIGRIGKLSDFAIGEGHYFKGQLIRLEGTDNDAHELAEIISELNKGVFI